MKINEKLLKENYADGLPIPAKLYFYAKFNNGAVETKGLHQCLLGHKIKNLSSANSDGIFAEWQWNGQKLNVINDRYGFFPLYYYYRDNEIILSPSIRTLLEQGASTELDYPAVAVFLRLGYFIGDDTPFKYIHALPPDTTFNWELGHLNVQGRYARRELITISEDDAIDQYIHLFRESIKKRLPSDENFVVPLSSGRDSRHILLELNHLGYKPKACLTIRQYTTSYVESLTPAKMLSEALKCNHLVFDEGEVNFANEIRNIELTNYCADEHSQFLPMVDYIRQNQVKTSYDGIAGDVLSAIDLGKIKLDRLLKISTLSEISQLLFKSHLKPVDYDLAHILNKDFYAKVNIECAVARLNQELNNHAQFSNPTKSFWFWNRTRREIALAPYALYENSIKVYSPYLDHKLYDFLMALPEEFASRQANLHTKAINRAYPMYQNISYESNVVDQNIINENKIDYLQMFVKYYFKNIFIPLKLVERLKLLPRMVKCLFSRKCCEVSWWMAPPTLLYLSCLEKLLTLGEQTRKQSNAK